MNKFVETFKSSKYTLVLLNLLLAGVFLVLAMTSWANAFEITPSIVLENTVTTEYSVENDTFDSSFESELIYGVNPNLSAHLLATFDLNDPQFTGAQMGVEFTPVQLDGLTASAYSVFNADLEYTDTTLELEFKF
jgi:hypothetical protein